MGEWRAAAELQHEELDLRHLRHHGVPDGGLHTGTGRCRIHWHTCWRRCRPEATAFHEGRRYRAHRDYRPRCAREYGDRGAISFRLHREANVDLVDLIAAIETQRDLDRSEWRA